jgi:hypothetical protein
MMLFRLNMIYSNLALSKCFRAAIELDEELLLDFQTSDLLNIPIKTR